VLPVADQRPGIAVRFPRVALRTLVVAIVCAVRFKKSEPSGTDPSPVPEGIGTVQEIYDRWAPEVERWARRLAGPRLDPEDLLHEIFLVVMRKRHEFRGEAKLSTWLFRITQQVVRWRRRNEAVRALLFGRHAAETAHVGASVPTPIEELERRERLTRLYVALDRLPDKYRTVLVLHSLEGLSGERIAELVGIETNAVWVRLHRARARLAELILDEKGRLP
jgi:RNA polymerase sigma-70 factor, ECF subfamily